MKISFDFDSTLSESFIQQLSTSLLGGNEVFIITSRVSNKSHNIDLFRVASKAGIAEENIFFTEGDWKWKKIKDLEIDIHFDDVPEECELIKLNTKCLPLLLWDEYSKASIKHETFGKGLF